jgi:hypothetical protein
MNAYPRKLARILAVGALTCMAGALSPAFAQHSGGGGGGHSSGGGGGGHSSGGGGGGHSSGGGGGGHANYAVGARGSYGGAHYASGYGGGGYYGHGGYNGHGGFYGRGFYGGYGHGGFWHGGCCFGPRFGFGWFLPVLPAFYATYWWGGIPYYYANDAYYTWSPDYNGYVATDPPAGPADNDSQPPPGSAQAPASGQTYNYPKNGQTDEQQASDRYQCHQWAVSQSGYDPTRNGAAIAGQDDYHRALTACMEGRGYSVR